MSSVYMYADGGDEIVVRQPKPPTGMFEVRIGDHGTWLFLAREQAEQLHAELGRVLGAESNQDGA
jgi:hypothetical protein